VLAVGRGALVCAEILKPWAELGISKRTTPPCALSRLAGLVQAQCIQHLDVACAGFEVLDVRLLPAVGSSCATLLTALTAHTSHSHTQYPGGTVLDR
jgi:hypothetical protein